MEKLKVKIVSYTVVKVEGGWVCAKIECFDDGSDCRVELIGPPDYKTIAIERCKKLVYGGWF